MKKSRWALVFGSFLFVGIVLVQFLPLPGCGAERMSDPQEVLQKITLGYPSILGYVRIHAEGFARLVRWMEWGEESDSINVLKLQMGLSFSSRLMKHIAPLCREGSHINMVFLDSKVFGGPMALHFETVKKGALTEALKTDQGFEHIQGSDPPEFIRIREAGFEEHAILLLEAIGFEGLGVSWGATHVVIEETPMGTLVLPSYDVRGDFSAFLEDSDRLKPWGEAAWVVNLEVHRLAQAYREEARQWSQTMASILSKVQRGFNDSHGWYGFLVRVARLVPETMLETVKAVEGLRFVSHSPWNNQQPELTFQAAEEGFLQELLGCFREGTPDLVGLIPQGLALQVNVDPVDWARLVRRFGEFYTDTLELDPHVVQKNLPVLLRSMASDTGQYLLGITWGIEGAGLILISTHEKDRELPPESGIDSFLDMLFPGEKLKGSRVGDGIFRYRLAMREGKPLPFPVPMVETGRTHSFRVFTVRVDADPESEELTSKTLHLARMGAGKVKQLPDGSVIYLKFALLPYMDLLLPQLGIPLGAIGHGIVEENRLIMRFLYDF